MRTTHSIISFFLASSLCSAAAFAADALPVTAKPAMLESISGTPSGNTSTRDECPMQPGKEECHHKNGEPCPHHHDDKHHGHTH